MVNSPGSWAVADRGLICAGSGLKRLAIDLWKMGGHCPPINFVYRKGILEEKDDG